MDICSLFRALIASFLLLLMIGRATEVSAQVLFVVNSTDDDPDTDPLSAVCDTGETNSGGVDTECTLRAAIRKANLTVATDTIKFVIPGTDGGCSGDICTIAPDSALPVIDQTVWIDATDVTGASCSKHQLGIELDGANAGSTSSGLHLLGINSNGSYIAGLSVGQFGRNGIVMDVSGGNTISCNNVGLDATGLIDRGNGSTGVYSLAGSGNVIGTHSSGAVDFSEGNLISGNFTGVTLLFGADNIVAGNVIGGDVDQTSTIGNGAQGVGLQCGERPIVGTNYDGFADDYERNVIVGNGYGVYLSCTSPSSMDYQVNGNFIGTDITATHSLGNIGHGIYINEANQAITDGSIKGNTITNSTFAGIATYNAEGLVHHSITENKIYANGGLGIDLNEDGLSANDAGDKDLGPNNLQNTPVFALALISNGGADLDITYYVDSDPSNSAFPVTVEVFFADGDGEEGEVWVGSDTLTVAEYNGCGTPPCLKKVTIAGVNADPGDKLVATATDADGNTSEFSASATAFANVVAFWAKVFLEGPYTGPGMSTVLQAGDHLPLSQPFSDDVYNTTVLDFDSTQTAPIPATAVDWVLVSLRTGTTAGSAVEGSQQAAILHSDGVITSPNDDSLRFGGIADGSYYLVVRGRNHLDVISSTAIDASDGTGTWDFSTASTQAFGTAPMKDLGSGVWGLFAADGNGDKQTTAPDFNLWNAATTAGATGFEPSDYNLDGIVTAPDFNLWNANTTAGASSKVPD